VTELRAPFIVDSSNQRSSKVRTSPDHAIIDEFSPTPMFDDLNPYQVTTHINRPSIVDIDGNRATGESCAIAHHLFTDDGEPRSLRYQDRFVKIDGAWYFLERNLILDSGETRPCTPPRQWQDLP